MPDLTIVLIMSGVSLVILALGRFVRPLTRICGAACLVWLAAALPILFFTDVDSQHVLLFYLISAALGLIIHFGGKPA